METTSPHTTTVHIIACASFASLNMCLALLYNAIGLAVTCAVVLTIIWAEKKMRINAAVHESQRDPNISLLFRIAVYNGVGTLAINALLATRTAFNTGILNGGSGLAGLILTALSLAAYIPLFVRLRRSALH
ncbi:hypothetical protein [Brevibacterium luteolum]|uniref:hypothetical protein n=1 Tax=Brevibacterium luteolum TaxID=199591 RepID=UPI003B67BE77